MRGTVLKELPLRLVPLRGTTCSFFQEVQLKLSTTAPTQNFPAEERLPLLRGGLRGSIGQWGQ